jgi:hypothetical protein
MNSLIILMFIVIIIIGIGLMVIIAVTRKAPPGLNQEEFRSTWLSIESSLGQDSGSHQLAILNADKLLDKALKARGYKGDTMGDRLKNARTAFKNNNAVWAAHKLRNQIAHEDVEIKPHTVRQALAAFKTALKDLGAL